MATAAEIRDWGRAHGFDVNERGQVRTEIREAFEMANGTLPTEADFPDATGEPPDDTGELFDESALDGAVAPRQETPPRKPTSSISNKNGRKPRAPKGSVPGGGRIRNLLGGKAKGPGRPKTRRPRISTEDMLAGLWRTAAKFATPLPPLHRTLRIQAPVAGMLLEEAVRDTAADVLLQPFARLAGQGKVVGALVGPPMIVTAMMLHVQMRAQRGEAPNEILLSFGQEALRGALMSWMDVAGPKFEVAIRREVEFEDKYGASVDDLIAFLLAPPATTPAEVEQENARIRRAQGYVDEPAAA